MDNGGDRSLPPTDAIFLLYHRSHDLSSGEKRSRTPDHFVSAADFESACKPLALLSMAVSVGFEPTERPEPLGCFQGNCINPLCQLTMVDGEGIEPPAFACKAKVLPLYEPSKRRDRLSSRGLRPLVFRDYSIVADFSEPCQVTSLHPWGTGP